MRYPSMSSGDNDEAPRKLLRVPGALAVAFVGSAAAVSVWYGGCQRDVVDPSPDAGQIEAHADAAVDTSIDAPTAMIDAAPPTPDAPRDAAPPIDAPPVDAPPT